MNDKELSTKLSTGYQQQRIIIKSNKLIESSYSLTTTQNRLLYLAMTKLKYIVLDKNMNIEDVEDAINKSKFELINITVLDYKETFKIKSNNLYLELQKMATDLFEEKIMCLDEEGNLTVRRWVITCKYDNKQKGISLQFHPDLIRDLLVFKSKFTKMIFDEFASKLKNKYSFRIYELCKQYMQIKKRDFDVSDLRFKLRIEEDEYKKYSDFKKRVLTTAIKEINTFTDIELELEEIEKVKRKVVKIRFNIKPKATQMSIFDNKKASTGVRLVEEKNTMKKLFEITGQRLDAKQSEIILSAALNKIDNDKLSIGVSQYIKEKSEICDAYMKRTPNKVKNYLGLLLTAINEDWQDKEIETTKFNNFDQRIYDYDILERQLLGWETED